MSQTRAPPAPLGHTPLTFDPREITVCGLASLVWTRLAVLFVLDEHVSAYGFTV
jgi:hypothetical protein